MPNRTNPNVSGMDRKSHALVNLSPKIDNYEEQNESTTEVVPTSLVKTGPVHQTRPSNIPYQALR